MVNKVVSILAIGVAVVVLTMVLKPQIGEKRGSAAPKEKVLTGDQLCERDLQKFVTFRDPESVKINSIEPNPDRPGRYFLSVSAKNGVGGYNMPVNCTCGTDVSKALTTDMHCDGS